MRKQSLKFFLLLLCLLCLAAVSPWSSAQAAPGDFLLKWGAKFHFSLPGGIAIDRKGNFFIADSYLRRVQKISSSGQLLAIWGSAGSGDGQFGSLTTLAVDSDGFVYVADTLNDRIQKFDNSGKYLAQWGSNGTGNGEFDSPMSVAVDESGNVYVVDQGNDRIQKFNRNGGYLGQWGSSGSDPGQFSFPFGVAVDRNGTVYVADDGNDRIQKFTGSGEFLGQWGSYGSWTTRHGGIVPFGAGGGQFNYPQGVALDGSGNVYVVDSGNDRIQKFDSSGNFLAQIGSYGHDNGELWSPTSVAIDANGMVCVADTYNDRIMFFNSAGSYVAKWATYSTDDGEFENPNALALDATGNVYVTDSVNGVQAFTGSGRFLWKAMGSLAASTIGIAASSDGNLYVSDSNSSQIDVFDFAGGLLKTIASGGAGDGRYWYPEGLALDGSGNILVADPYNSRILKFSKSGDLLTQLGSSGTGDGAFSSPADVAVDGKGNIYVVDTANYRIQKFDSNGKYLTQWGTLGTGDGQFELPRGVAADASGFVYVADSYNHRVQVFTGDGTFVKVLGGPVWGDGDGELNFPTGVATDAMGTRLYVADSGNYRIQAFVGFGVTHFAVSAPSSADAGSAFAATVTALDAAGKVVTGYTGTVRLASSDGSARLPANMPLTNGVGNFQVTLMTPGEQTLTATDSVTASITGASERISVSSAPCPDLTIDNRHSGDFSPGGLGTYTITVTNSGTGPTVGAVSVEDHLPQGVTVRAVQGDGWSCNTKTMACTRSNPLAAGASYPPIMVTVEVSQQAPLRLVNQVSVSGGGESNTLNDTASDEIEVQQDGKGHKKTSSQPEP